MDTSIIIPKNVQGFTLTEIMVALLISSILLGGVVTMMSSSKRTYALQNEMAELQDNARFVMDELTRELRMAGFFGCSGTPPAGISNPFQGSQNDQTIIDENGKNVSSSFPRSDILSITSFAQALSVAPATLFDFGGSQITLNPGSILPDPVNPIIVSDCAGSTSYPFNFTGGIISLSQPLIRDYQQPVDVFRGTTTVTYQVGGISEGGFALFKNGQILVEGIQNMQVRYGIDINNDGIPNRYNNVIGNNVSSVRVTVLMRTAKKRGIGEPPSKVLQLDPDVIYDLSNKTVKAHETGYRHRIFTTTVDIRNYK